MIHITDDQKDTILSVIHDDEFWADNHVRKLTLEETFYFETFADRPFAQYLADRNRVIIPNEDDGYIEFIIEEVEQLFDRTKTVYGNASYLELQKQKVIDPQTLQSQTATQSVDFALNGTEWQAGTIAYTTIRTIEIETHTNAYALLKQIASAHGLELNFRVEIEGSKIIGRYVDLVEKVGSYIGREVVFGEDLIGIKRTEKTDQIVSALVGLGPDKGDGTPRLEVFVEDLDARQRWGRNGQHLVETYEPQSSNTDMTEAQLRTYTETELAKRVNAIVEYEGTIANLEAIPGLEGHRVRFGDTIRIKDEGFFPPLYLEARVHTQERSIKSAKEKTFVLGDYIEYTQEEVMALFVKMQSQIAQAMNQREIHVGMSPPDDVSQHWIDISREPNVFKRFDESSGMWIKVTPTEASEVGAATPQEVRDMSETERLKGHKVTILREKTAIDDKHDYLIAKPQMYTQSVKDELIAAKTNLDNMYNALVTSIDTAISDEVITTTERTDIETATDNYRLAIARWEVAYADGEDDVAAGRTADAEQASQDYVQDYAQQKIVQGTVAPSNPVTGDLWIDTSVNPYVWKQWNGSAWIKLTRTTASEVGAETPSGAQAKADAAKSAAESAAQSYTESYAQKKVTSSSTAPTSPNAGDLWIDTSKTPNVWKRWSGSAWVKATADAFAELTGTVGANQIAANTITTTMISTAGLDAGVIKTGVLDAGRVRIGSTTQFDANYDPTTKETPSGAQSKANTAESNAKGYADTQYSGTKTLVDGWKYSSTTYIDGGNIYTGTVTANKMASKTITANQIASNTLDSSLITTDGLDAGVIKFGTMSGDRILTNSLNADRLKAGTIIANDITFTGKLQGATGTFSGKLQGAVMEVYNPSAGYTYMDFRQGTEPNRVRFGGNGIDAFILQTNNPTYGDWNLENLYVYSDFSRFYGNAYFYDGYNGEMRAAIEGKSGLLFGKQLDGHYGTMMRSYDEWLRINDNSANLHTNGVYFGSSRVRTDYRLEVGSGGGTFACDSGQFTYKGKAIRYGTDGIARVPYQVNTRLRKTVSHGLGTTPGNIMLTIRWISGSESMDYIGTLYTENVNSSTFDIVITNNYNTLYFDSASWVDVYWSATP